MGRLMTEYTVLASKNDQGWYVLDTVDAPSKKKAEEIAFLKNPDGITAVNAVPTRSWQPTPIRVAPRAVFGD